MTSTSTRTAGAEPRPRPGLTPMRTTGAHHVRHVAGRRPAREWELALQLAFNVLQMSALLFLAVACPLALPALSGPSFDPGLALVLVGLYAVVSRMIKFPIGAGYVVPSYLVLVPMLLLLPPATVPLLTAAGLVAGTLVRVVARRANPSQVLYSIPDAWHALGPALVLLVAAPVHGDAQLTGTLPVAFDLVTLDRRFDLVEVLARHRPQRLDGVHRAAIAGTGHRPSATARTLPARHARAHRPGPATGSR